MNLHREISLKAAEILISLKCINFSPNKPFKLTSGKLSPVYCDCRKIIGFPMEREKLIDFGIKKLENLKIPEFLTNISGGESAGIPFASFMAQKLKLPMSYVRKQKKCFGKGSQIEGVIKKNDKILLVEDLITDGGSKINFVEAINEVNAEVKAIFVIFNYGINKEFLKIKNKKIKIIFLTSWKEVLEVVDKKRVLNSKDILIVKNFLESIGVKN